MAQSLNHHVGRMGWLGDMEPEYEEMLEWMVLVGELEGVPPEARVPLHWAVVAQAQRGAA